MRKTKETKKNKGITLMALVITIIVLLILAGVSIATLTGNNGILKQVNQAKENTNSEAAKEKVQVEALGSIDKDGKFNSGTFKNNLETNLKLKASDIVENEDEIKTITVTIDGYDVTVDGTTGKVTGVAKSNGEKPATGVSKTEKDNYTDDNKEKATIPEGFKVSEKDDEKNISDGLVVIGPDGSEFVWIPVSNINNMAQCSTAGGNCDLQLNENTLKCITHNNTEIVGKLYHTETGENFGQAVTSYNKDEGLREPAYLTNTKYGDASSYNTVNLTEQSLKDDYKNMATSVAKYGGFYVGRYETSYSNATETDVGNSSKVQSKKAVIPVSTYDTTNKSWYGLYNIQNKNYSGKNNSVESSMIWGSQFDAILNWAEKIGNDKSKITTNNLGNTLSGKIATTGNEEYKIDTINNIRDLGGNLSECTLEGYMNSSRVIRGGAYIDGSGTGTENSPSFPSYMAAAAGKQEDSAFGSRMTLYIKWG